MNLSSPSNHTLPPAVESPNVPPPHRTIAPLLFLFDTLICQGVGASTVILSWQVIPNLGIALTLGTLIAMSLAHFFAMPFAWQLLNVIALPAIAASLAIQIPSWVFLLLLVGTTIIYAPAFWTRVPYYPTSTPTYLMLLPELPTDKEFSFIDLGCGFGDLLFFLAKQRPSGRYVGVEVGILPCLVGKVRALLFGKGRVTIKYQSIWSTDLSTFDYVYTFLSPAPMNTVWQKVSSEMSKGSTYINNSFSVPAPATREIQVRDEKGSVLYVHVL